MSRPWFKNSNCNELLITRFKSLEDSKVLSSLRIKDKVVIEKLMKRIESVPADGDMMKSFSDDSEFITLKFQCEDKSKQIIELINKRFKTPSTGFNSSEVEVEQKLATDIESLLSPELDKKLLKVEKLEVIFKEFTLTYAGHKERHQKPGEPTIGTMTTYYFSIKDQSGTPQEISMTSGQLAPQPTEFLVNGKKYYLLTYQTNSGERLYSDYFAVTKSLNKKLMEVH